MFLLGCPTKGSVTIPTLAAMYLVVLKANAVTGLRGSRAMKSAALRAVGRAEEVIAANNPAERLVDVCL